MNQPDVREDLKNLLLKIPALEDKASRTVLLSGLEDLSGAIARSDNKVTDVSNIVESAWAVGQRPTGEWPLLRLMRNAQRFCPVNTQLGQSLRELIQQYESFYDLRRYLDSHSQQEHLFIHYLRELWKKCSAVRLPGSQTSEGDIVSLPAVYVPLNTTDSVVLSKGTDGKWDVSEQAFELEGSYLKQRITDEADGLPPRVRNYSRQLSALEILEYAPRLVMIGPPGCGKSTFACFVTLCMAGEILKSPEANLSILNEDLSAHKLEPWPHRVLLPIFVELGLFVRSKYFPPKGTVGLVDHLLNYIESEMSDKDPNIRDYLGEMPRGTLFILDGLDEVQESEMSRERIRQVIASLVQVYPNCRTLVTSRPYAYDNPAWRLDREGFSAAFLEELNGTQIRKFIFCWYDLFKGIRGGDPELWRARGETLISEIELWPYLLEMAVNPQLLTMTAIAYEQGGGILPLDRVDLYEEITKLLLYRWDHQRGLDTPIISQSLRTRPRVLRDKLDELAFTTHRDDRSRKGQITYDMLKEALASIPGTSDATIQLIMEYLHQRSGILVADNPKLFRFPLPSFQEFMAACYLSKHDDFPDFPAKLARQNPELWREVMLFTGWRALTNRPRDVWELADKLCTDEFTEHGRPSHSDWGAALLAALILTETGEYEKETVDHHRHTLANIRGWLIACVERGEMGTLERAEAGRILGYIGDTRRGIGAYDGIPDIRWIPISAGDFWMGSAESDNAAIDNEKPQLRAQIDYTYRISKYPITVAQFRLYVNSDSYPTALRDIRLQQLNGNPRLYIDNHPIDDVTWGEAEGFCHWLSEQLSYEVRLPKENEWEKAARSTDGRIFPWGKTFQRDRCNCNIEAIGRTSAVGIFPKGASPYGVMDMAGNVWEWCIPIKPVDFGAGGDIQWVNRGGSFGVDVNLVRCANRSPGASADLLIGQGFRVVTLHDVRDIEE